MLPRTLFRPQFGGLLLALLLAGPAAATTYPTDRCVSEKLRAAARECAQTIRAWQQPSQLEKRLSRVEARLAGAWRFAEARAARQGTDCSETTVGSPELAQLLADAAEEVADLVDAHSGPACRTRALQTAARVCAGLLAAESSHLAHRYHDRDGAYLAHRRERALQHASVAGRAHGRAKGHRGRGLRCGGDLEDAVVERVETLVEDVVAATTVSPHVPTEWTMITPPAQLEYEGRTLAPICSRGTPYVYFVKRGSVNKLLVYYQGGGACWDVFTCGETLETFKTSTGPRDNPANVSSGFFDLDNPENPFADWNMVFVPYCTGDVHWGDARFVHTFTNLDPVVIEHRGYVNTRVVEKWMREHFVNPEVVFVTGSSAGAYGAIVNSLPLQEFVYPSSDFAVLGDAGNGVITDRFLENDISKWGIEQNLPPWIPALNLPITELDAANLWFESALFYPENRFANYTTAYDGGEGGQTGFFWVMLNNSPELILTWPEWWRGSCDWNAGMRELAAKAIAGAANYRSYIGTGSAHTVWERDKVYTDTTGGVPRVVDWVEGMIAGSAAWTNVECDDCGLLLPGDPRPPSPIPPFTEDGRIVCE